ncbi:hypothetical protein [Thermomonas sp.]|uniref:hypothetical protein n=1 Tax=Thermomonas sp. TaxID=1971895 RepID=UPI0026350F66|nr:hypothetical protein [Thermomonas sp.]MCO5055285.1 hypothetical protein [Thermomonas sp.]
MFGAGTCLPLAQWQAEGKRGFVVASAGTSPEQDEADARPFTVNFKITVDGKASTGQLTLPEVDPAAIVFDDRELQQNAQVCDGRVFIVNLAEERGGVLAIGNLKDGALAMTSLAYASGDEDTAEVGFKDGTVVVTDRNGSVRLQESSATDPATPAHGLVAESVQVRTGCAAGPYLAQARPQYRRRRAQHGVHGDDARRRELHGQRRSGGRRSLSQPGQGRHRHPLGRQ